MVSALTMVLNTGSLGAPEVSKDSKSLLAAILKNCQHSNPEDIPSKCSLNLLLVIGIVSSLTWWCRDVHPWVLLQHHWVPTAPHGAGGQPKCLGSRTLHSNTNIATGQLRTSISAKISLVSDTRSKARIPGLPPRTLKMPTPWQVSFQHAEEKRSHFLELLLQKPGRYHTGPLLGASTLSWWLQL